MFIVNLLGCPDVLLLDLFCGDLVGFTCCVILELQFYVVLCVLFGSLFLCLVLLLFMGTLSYCLVVCYCIWLVVGCVGIVCDGDLLLLI